ncbi:MAG: regulatory protein RecX [Pseudomonadota bacterium]
MKSWKPESQNKDAARLTPAACRKRAMDALARREHSRFELERKLASAGFDGEVIVVVLDRLAEERLQCDQRFAESFVSSRYRQGKGPLKIRADLSQRGLSDAEIEHALRSAALDWRALASEVRERKFGAAKPDDYQEKARQCRFLAARGFDAQTAIAVASGGSSVE